MLSTLAALPAIRNQVYDSAEEILRSVHAENPEYLNITLTDRAGRITASSLLPRGTDLFKRPHIQRSLLSRRFSTGEYIIGLVQSEPSFSYSYPLLADDNSVLGTVNTLYKLSSYSRIFNSLDLNPASFFGLVDRNGIRLYFYPPKDSNPIGGPVKQSVWEKIQAGPDSGTFLDVSSDRILRIYGYQKLRMEGDSEPYITVVYAAPRDSILAVSRTITRRNLLAMAAAALSALALSWILSEVLFGRRLSRIGAAVNRIRAGDLAARVGLEGDASDLGRIASALDGMADAVQKRDADGEHENLRLNRLVEDKEILLKEIHHRVKNNLQMTLSLIRLQASSCADGEPASFKGLESRIASMAMVHEMLYSSSNLKEIDLCEYSSRLIELLERSYTESGGMDVSLACETVRCSLETAIPFGLLLAELVTNAFKHASGRDSAAVSVILATENGFARLSVSDNGPGLPPDFEPSQTRGLGLQLVLALTAQMEGTLTWESKSGALFKVEFPLDARKAPKVEESGKELT